MVGVLFSFPSKIEVKVWNRSPILDSRFLMPSKFSSELLHLWIYRHCNELFSYYLRECLENSNHRVENRVVKFKIIALRNWFAETLKTDNKIALSAKHCRAQIVIKYSKIFKFIIYINGFFVNKLIVIVATLSHLLIKIWAQILPCKYKKGHSSVILFISWMSHVLRN